ncbi:hypothetical protein BBK82_08060 [Lentzea guizhouensis]|uniref:Orc1-like AAA ATPase domain-containing protein n=1 Tax=Lentzea guizhouensis TaxID=1586287 RepID=A0A1B2HE80_9PSEU|nr:hypothetical protein BBK82_08060 [Lentzea guizhouensis]
MNEAEYINTVSGSVYGQVLQARTVTADTIVLQASERRGRVPRQLPPPGRTWVDRVDELERLDRLLATAGPTRVVVTGLGGVGKTGLAVRWLDAHHERYPDGVLHIDLNGWSGHPPPATPQVLAGWLRALGIAADDLPGEVAELVALYRTVTADKAVAVLVDNAAPPSRCSPWYPPRRAARSWSPAATASPDWPSRASATSTSTAFPPPPAPSSWPACSTKTVNLSARSCCTPWPPAVTGTHWP